MVDIVNGLLIRHGRVLMARRSSLRPRYPGSWSFPGGQVEAGETFDAALFRELREEVGIRIGEWSLLDRFVDPATEPEHPVIFHMFAVTKWYGSPINLGDEHTEIRWVALADAAAMPDLTFARYGKILWQLSDK